MKIYTRVCVHPHAHTPCFCAHADLCVETKARESSVLATVWCVEVKDVEKFSLLSVCMVYFLVGRSRCCQPGIWPFCGRTVQYSTYTYSAGIRHY